MVIFAWPMMLGFAGVVAVVGAVALWRGMRGVQKVSSTRLWEGLTEMAAGGKRRAVDPVWLMVFLAGVMGAVAAAGPGWRSGAGEPKVDLTWAVRSVGEGEAELFVRVKKGAALPEVLEVEVRDGGQIQNSEFRIQNGEGTALVKVPAGEGRVMVRLQAGKGERGAVLAKATFTRPAGAAFGLLTQTGRGRGIDAGLWRVFAVNGGARVNDATVLPCVLLVDDPHFAVGGVSGETLVVGSPGTAMPGIVLGEKFKPMDATPVAVNLPAFVQLGKVRVREAMGATLSKEWEVLATVDGKPWLARRKLSEGPVLVWMGSLPATETNWGLDVSFPVFFTDLLARTFPGGKGVGGGILDWTEERVAVGGEGKVREYGVSWVLGSVAIGLLAGAMVMLVRRSR